MDGKALLMSKTFWINVIALLGIVLQGSGVIAGAEWAPYEVGVLGIVNIVLRLVTKEPITGVVVTPE